MIILIDMQTLPKPEIGILEYDLEELQDVALWELVVFNDDYNTFEHVISTLMDVCRHSPEQAEQCTVMIHYKGKSSVKSGEFAELASMRNEICRRGISAEVAIR